MAAYKTLKGQSIRKVASDPTNAQLGEIWYNTTTGVLKGKQYITGVFISGGNMNTSRSATGSSTLGTQTSSLVFGGESSGGNRNLTEAYNGTTWSEVADLNTTRKNLMGAGTQTAALGFGGYTNPGGFTNVTEEWNGTSWTNGNAMNRAKDSAGKVGTQTAALSVAGRGTPGVTTLSDVEEYNGTNWSISNALPVTTNRGGGLSGGNSTICAGLSLGGYQSGVAYEYNKEFLLPFTYTAAASSDSWSGGPLMLVNRNGMGAAGTQNAALGAGGYRAPTGTAGITCTEEFNGTVWSAGGSLAIARYALHAELVLKMLVLYLEDKLLLD